MIVKWQTEMMIPWDLLLEADPDREIVEKYFYTNQCLISESKNGLNGVIVFGEIAPQEYEIFNLSVAETEQRKGIGGQLITAAENEIRQLADGKVTITIRTGDISPARHLYEKMGYQVVECVENYFIEHYDEPIYEEGQQLYHQIILQKKK